MGTRNRVKVAAVDRVFRRYMDARVEPVSVDPGVPSQPVGLGQLLVGAVNRAVRGIEATGAEYGVGVEAGPIVLGGIAVETQVAVVAESSGRAGLGFSPGFQLPSIVEAEVLAGRELGEVFPARRLGDLGEGIGVVGVLTRGGVTRLELTMQAVEMALLPLVNPSYYEPISVDALLRAARARDL